MKFFVIFLILLHPVLGSVLYDKLLPCSGSLTGTDEKKAFFSALRRYEKLTSLEEIYFEETKNLGSGFSLSIENYFKNSFRVEKIGKFFGLNDLTIKRIPEVYSFIQLEKEIAISDLTKSALFKTVGKKESRNKSEFGLSFSLNSIFNSKKKMFKSSRPTFKAMEGLLKGSGIEIEELKIGLSTRVDEPGTGGFFVPEHPNTIFLSAKNFLNFFEGVSDQSWVLVHEFVHLLFYHKSKRSFLSGVIKPTYKLSGEGDLGGYSDIFSLEELPAYLISITSIIRAQINSKSEQKPSFLKIKKLYEKGLDWIEIVKNKIQPSLKPSEDEETSIRVNFKSSGEELRDNLSYFNSGFEDYKLLVGDAEHCLEVLKKGLVKISEIEERVGRGEIKSLTKEINTIEAYVLEVLKDRLE